MKSTVDIEIHAPQIRVAELFADPGNSPRWMDDLERIEEISGQPGSPGSRYRMVSKDRRMDLVATVVARDLPKLVQLRLDGSDITVSITYRFATVSADITRLTSEEIFTFSGPLRTLFGVLVHSRIKKAHRRHMESFKRFAEGRGQFYQES
jgi:hypothetical protein